MWRQSRPFWTQDIAFVGVPLGMQIGVLLERSSNTDTVAFNRFDPWTRERWIRIWNYNAIPNIIRWDEFCRVSVCLDA